MSHAPAHRSEHSHTAAGRTRAGFTLIELMVAMTAGAIAISSMFFISSASTHYFRVQQRLTNMQSSLRIAMDQLRRDVGRAGFGGTPSQAFYPACNRTAGILNAANFRAINVIDAGSPANVDPRGIGVHQFESGAIEADALRLFGNYSTSSDYVIDSVLGATITPSPNRQAFTRDFSNWDQPAPSTLTINAAAYNAAFMPGRLVRIRSTEGSRFFSTVVSTAVGANPSVTVAPQIVPGDCATLQNGLFNPVSIMEYRVENAVAPLEHATSNTLGDKAPAGINRVLVRRELNPADVNNRLPGTVDRVIAERVIHFNVDLLVEQTGLRTQTPTVAPAADLALNTFPERIFSAIVTLAVRAPTADRRFPWIPQPAGAVLTRYSFNDEVAGATQVRFARAEIFLPNVADEWTR